MSTIQGFTSILDHAVSIGASDVHLGVGQRPAVRVDGDIVFYGNAGVISDEDMRQILREILNDEQIARLNAGQEIDGTFPYRDGIRFRINAYKEMRGANLALRYIPQQLRTLDDLQLPAVIKKFVHKPHGLVLVVGPTGAGKSTTTTALINHINVNQRKHIILLEDSIEYIFTSDKSLIKQRSIGKSENSGSFPQAIIAAMREDPDVLMVGDLRDREAMSLALSAAETGHLVIAQVHSSNTLHALNRIISAFPGDAQSQAREQLAQQLVGIISQRLVAREGGGRAAAVEILINTSVVATQIRDNAIGMISNTIKMNSSEGMILFEDSVKELMRSQTISQAKAREILGT